MSHTPGPWSIGVRMAAYRDTKEVFPAFDALSVGTPRGQVAIIPLDESSEANARLIATVPDLLEAAIQTVDELGGFQNIIQYEGFAKLQSIVNRYKKAADEVPA